MTPTDTTPRKQYETLSFEVDLRHPPEKVWRALTDPELMSEWLMPVVDFGLAPGTAFNLMAPPQPGWDGIVNCRILEVEAHRTLRYTWATGEMELDTVVTFTLVPTESGTHLKIEQSGFKPDQKRAFGGARYGWRMMSTRLVEVIERLG
ncbi:MAG TPA: SRPBCC domain-containing protein [Rhodothermales bacterium]